jgi:hypothetical protein
MVEFGKAVSETYFLAFFKDLENSFPKPRSINAYAHLHHARDRAQFLPHSPHAHLQRDL